MLILNPAYFHLGGRLNFVFVQPQFIQDLVMNYHHRYEGSDSKRKAWCVDEETTQYQVGSRQCFVLTDASQSDIRMTENPRGHPTF